MDFPQKCDPKRKKNTNNAVTIPRQETKDKSGSYLSRWGQRLPNPSLVLYLPPHVLWLPGNFYILSSWRSGVFSPSCLALDSSSSFPCPAFRAIAKSVVVFLSLSQFLFWTVITRGVAVEFPQTSTVLRRLVYVHHIQEVVPRDQERPSTPLDLEVTGESAHNPIEECQHAKMGRRQCKSAYNIIKNKTTPESSPPPTPKSDYCNADKAEENDLKKSLMKMLEEAFEEKMKNVSKEIGENTNKKLEEINKEIEEKKSKKLEEMNNEIEEKKNKKLEEMNNEIEEKKNKRVEEMNKEIEEKRNKKLQELDKEIEEKINKKLKEMNKEIEEKTNKKLEEINKVIEEKTNKKLDEINKEIEDKTNKKLEKINKEIDGKKTKELEEMKKEIEEKVSRQWGEIKKFEEKKNKRLEEMNKENEEKTNKKMEDLKKVLKESQDNQQKTIKHMKETTQDIKIETEKLKKTLSEGMLEIEKLSKRSGNTDASITNRIQEMEDRISNVEDTTEEIDSTVKENTKTKKVIKQNVQEIWDTMKRPNIRIIGIEEGEEYQLKGTENIFNKIIEENFPNLKKEPPIKIQEAYRTPNRLDPQKKSSRHIIIKTLNIQNKERILRAAKEKGQLTYKGRPIRITPDFSMETLQARRSWSDIIQTLRDHRCQPRIIYPAKLSITIDGVNKTFQDKTRFEQYLSTNPALQKALEGRFQPKETRYTHENKGNR
ncbi:hypothetical protein STEG23_031369 [Scotinomys teguina]